jgi:hypothetical protein
MVEPNNFNEATEDENWLKSMNEGFHLAQPLRVSINAKGGYCWHVWQEGVCFSLMERAEGGA